MADPIKTAKNIFNRFLTKHDPHSMPGYVSDGNTLKRKVPDAKEPERAGWERPIDCRRQCASKLLGRTLGFAGENSDSAKR
jgi:hypothetical protein